MKTFLNIIGLLALLGSLVVFVAGQTAINEIEGCIAMLLCCTSLGLAKIIELQEQAGKSLAALAADVAAANKADRSQPPPVAEKLPAIPGRELYYVSDGKDAMGPHPAETIRAFLSRGTVNSDTLILKQGATEWVKLGTIFRPPPFKVS